MQQRVAFARGPQQAARVMRPSLHMQARRIRCAATNPNPSGTTTTTTVPGHEELDKAVQDLLAAARAAEPETFPVFKRVQEAKVQPQVNNVIEVAKKLGVNRIEPSLNAPVRLNGLMSTDLRQITTDSTLTFERLTFGQMQPKNTLIRNTDKKAQQLTGRPDMIKGPFEGDNQAYVVFSHFRILQGEVQPDGSRAPPTVHEPDREDDLLGAYTIMGSWTLDPEKPQRLPIKFYKMRLEPADPEQLDAWVKFLGPHNPGMDPKTGRVEFPLNFPAGHLDYIAMTPKYSISRGNLGSVVVMETASN